MACTQALPSVLPYLFMSCNTSTITLEQQCYGRGSCVVTNSSNPALVGDSLCDCQSTFVPETYCRLSQAEYLNFADVALYIVRFLDAFRPL
jgi:hypothetical protein